MTDQHFSQHPPRVEENPKVKGRERMLLTPPAKKMRMSRRKVEH